MKTFFKGLALLVAITCVVWIAVLWRWQTTMHSMDGADLVMYLIALPLALFVLVLAARWAIRGALAAQAAAAAGGSAAGSSAASADASDAPAAVHPGWKLLGAWAQTSAGADPAALGDQVAEGEPRPAPDAELVDDDGLPVMCARIEALDLDALRDSFNGAVPPALQADDVLRTLATLPDNVAALAQSVLSWPQAFALKDDDGRARTASRIRVLVGWPRDWSAETAAAATDWLSRQLVQATEPLIPPQAWVLQTVQTSGPELLMAADRLLATLEQQQLSDLVVVMAAHSDLSDPAVSRLHRQGRLFLANQRPRGVMPGEGSAIVLLGLPQWSDAPDAEKESLRLLRPQALSREQSADAPGRTDATATLKVVESTLKACGVESSQIEMLLTDAEQHTTRATEWFTMTLQHFPELDPAEDMRLLGVVTGHLGAAAPLVALAAANTQDTLPMLVASLGDTHWRLASIVAKAPTPQAAPT